MLSDENHPRIYTLLHFHHIHTRVFALIMRRATSLIHCNSLFILFILIITINHVIHVQSTAVIAIDFGTDLRVSMARSGASSMDLVLNTESRRKTSSVVGILGNDRLFGTNALYSLQKHPDRVYSGLKSLLGCAWNSTKVQEYLKLYPNAPLVQDVNRTYGIAMHHPDFDTLFTIEELVAMELSYLRNLAEKASQETVQEVVIAIPPCMDIYARNALLDAAEIAGLRVLELMHDVTAAALQYIIPLIPSLTETPKLYIFYNIGAEYATASLISYSQKQTTDTYGSNITAPFVDAIAHESISSGLGSSIIDEKIRQAFISMFHKEHPSVPIDGLVNNHKAMLRLLNEAQRMKQIFTINDELSSTLESLHDDRDLHIVFSRSMMEELCSDMKTPYVRPIRTLLEKTHRSLDQIESIVLFGGGSRVPFVRQAIKDYAGESKVTQNINIDEVIANGACLRSAALSKKFVVKDVRIIDRLSWSSYIRELGEDTLTPLFSPNTPLDTKKHITLRRNTDFSLEFHYNTDLSSSPQKLAQIDINHVASTIKEIDPTILVEEPKIKIAVQFDESAIINVEKVNLLWIYSKNITILNDTNSTNTTNNTNTTTINKTSIVDLPFEQVFSFPRLSSSVRALCIERSNWLNNVELEKRQKQETRNALEYFAYKVRDLMKDNSFISFIIPSLKEQISDTLKQVMDKIEDMEEFAIEQYQQELNRLEKLVKPIIDRQDNQNKLASIASSFRAFMSNVSSTLEGIVNKTEKHTRLIQKIKESKEWLETKTKEQKSKKNHEEPILWAHDIESKMKELENDKNNILSGKQNENISMNDIDFDKLPKEFLDNFFKNDNLDPEIVEKYKKWLEGNEKKEKEHQEL